MRIPLILLAALLVTGAALPPKPGWENRVAAALGKAGSEKPGGVYRVGLPRSDLTVLLDGTTINPALALSSWLAFMHRDDGVMVMGDLVLTDEEVNPVMTRLLEGGIEVTALHNHLLRATPHTMYMHIAGHGDPVELAATLHAALSLSHTPFSSSPSSTDPTSFDLRTGEIDAALGYSGENNGGVYSVSISRATSPRQNGIAIPDAMGSAIGINFQPVGGGRAAIAGDLILTADEVNPVLASLRESGIEITALHNHMLDEQPRLFFMHFWAVDDAGKLARAMGAALEHVAVAR